MAPGTGGCSFSLLLSPWHLSLSWLRFSSGSVNKDLSWANADAVSYLTASCSCVLTEPRDPLARMFHLTAIAENVYMLEWQRPISNIEQNLEAQLERVPSVLCCTELAIQ